MAGQRITGKSAFSQLIFGLALFSVSASRTSFGILLLSVLLVIFKRSKVIGFLCVAGVGVMGIHVLDRSRHSPSGTSGSIQLRHSQRPHRRLDRGSASV